MTRPRLIALLFALVGALLACKRGGGNDGEASGPPLFTKPIGELTKDELGGACAKLGWQNSGVTWSNSGQFSNIMASCTKESPDGTASPDGKKRARLTIALYKDPPTNVESRKQYLDGLGAAYKADGATFLSTGLHTKDKAEAEKLLRRLVAK